LENQHSLSEFAALVATHEMVGIKAGRGDHLYLSIWAVVVEGSVFIRSWGLQKGWYNTFLQDPDGKEKILLQEQLQDTKVYRIGKRKVHVYLLGKLSQTALLGIKTIVIQT
jgi:hypothetical protein